MSPELAPIIAAAIAINRKGHTPTLALVKTRMGGKIPMPLLVAGLQYFKNMSKEELAAFNAPSLTAPSPATATDEAGHPDLLARLTQMQQQVDALAQYCQQLEQRILQLENAAPEHA
ncbi:hypothetical protein [Shewanella sp. YIC-542]|uniref:hypothetical protein n=1 Tax=Shewanella mytili TaxID=3377111 RepID=UPI00398E3C96